MRTCSICPRDYWGCGYCRQHYRRWKKWGDPLAVGKYIKYIPSAERLDLYKEVDPVTGCWNWTGCLTRQGYGLFPDGKRKTSPHRMQYRLIHGDIEDHMAVCHKCDNRRCFNPEHLFLGTVADNQRDMVEKGRSARGERGGQAKLTAAQVLAIRADPRGPKQVAAEHGIAASTVCTIRSGRTWKHLLPPATTETSHGQPPLP